MNELQHYVTEMNIILRNLEAVERGAGDISKFRYSFNDSGRVNIHLAVRWMRSAVAEIIKRVGDQNLEYGTTIELLFPSGVSDSVKAGMIADKLWGVVNSLRELMLLPTNGVGDRFVSLEISQCFVNITQALYLLEREMERMRAFEENRPDNYPVMPMPRELKVLLDEQGSGGNDVTKVLSLLSQAGEEQPV